MIMEEKSDDIKGALTRLDAMPAPVQQYEPMDILARAVERGNVSVETIERLIAVRSQMKAEQAKESFYQAFAAFQADCPIVLRTKAGHENRYSYAPLEEIVRIVGPVIARHGFSYQTDSVEPEGWVEAIVMVVHKDGHSIEKRFRVPTESKSGMSLQQKYGAAFTYATRRAFCAAFGIATADTDTDCPPTEGKSVTELRKTLWELLKPVRGTESKWDIARRFLTDECNMDPAKRVQDLETAELAALIPKVIERKKALKL